MNNVYLRYALVALVAVLIGIAIDRWLLKRKAQTTTATDLEDADTIDVYIARNFPGASRVS